LAALSDVGAASQSDALSTLVAATPARSSTSDDQLPHSGQRPSQRGCCAPHAVQA